MDDTKIIITILVIFISLIALTPQPLLALPINDIQVVKIFPEDEKALVKTRKKGLKVIKAGDLLGKHVRVTQITEGRIVIENKGDSGIETVIIRMENGVQKTEKIRKAGDERPVLYSLQITEDINSEINQEQ